MIFHISYVTFSNDPRISSPTWFPEFSIIELYFVSGNWTDWDSNTGARRTLSYFKFKSLF
jgi:hypothetical protein